MRALADFLRSLGPAADALWSDAASRCAQGELACRPGCVGCCTGLFAISAAEALLVRGAVAALPSPSREEVRAAAETIRRATAVRFPGDADGGILDAARADEVDRFVSQTHEIPCPLLDVQGRCRIYESRPATCRTFGLALVSPRGIESPACALNFPRAAHGRALATGIDAGALRGIEQQADAALAAEGWDPSAQTTIAHAIAGTAFADAARGG